MGIKHGPTFYSYFTHGLYNKKPKQIKLNIDGENIRHKGKVAKHITVVNPENAIAFGGFNYLLGLVQQLESIFKIKIKSSDVLVYMDGKRDSSKCDRRISLYEEATIHNRFIKFCENYGFNVICLGDGEESELHMYLKRDQECELNIFISTDADMFGICYEHVPKLCDTSFNFNELTTLTHTDHHNVIDENFSYPDGLKIKDSCLWISPIKNLQFIGFDGAKFRINIKPVVFRVLITLSGTDYNKHFITNTMLKSILTSVDINHTFIMDFINNLTNLLDITVCLIYVGLRYGGSLCRHDKTTIDSSTNLDHLQSIIERYSQYILTAKLSAAVPKINVEQIQKLILNFMMNKKGNITAKIAKNWCESNSVQTALNNFQQNYSKHKALRINKTSSVVSLLKIV